MTRLKKRVEDCYNLVNMKNTIKFFVVASLLITCSCKKEVSAEENYMLNVQKNADAPKTKVAFDKEVHNFGEIKQGEIVSTTFTIKNVGDNDLYIFEAHGSCGCTVPEVTKSVLITCNTAKIVETISIKASIKSK